MISHFNRVPAPSCTPKANRIVNGIVAGPQDYPEVVMVNFGPLPEGSSSTSFNQCSGYSVPPSETQGSSQVTIGNLGRPTSMGSATVTKTPGGFLKISSAFHNLQMAGVGQTLNLTKENYMENSAALPGSSHLRVVQLPRNQVNVTLPVKRPGSDDIQMQPRPVMFAIFDSRYFSDIPASETSIPNDVNLTGRVPHDNLELILSPAALEPLRDNAREINLDPEFVKNNMDIIMAGFGNVSTNEGATPLVPNPTREDLVRYHCERRALGISSAGSGHGKIKRFGFNNISHINDHYLVTVGRDTTTGVNATGSLYEFTDTGAMAGMDASTAVGDSGGPLLCGNKVCGITSSGEMTQVVTDPNGNYMRGPSFFINTSGNKVREFYQDVNQYLDQGGDTRRKLMTLFQPATTTN